MNFQKLKKGLFSVKEVSEKQDTSPIKISSKERITYTDYGFHQAGRLGGTAPGLRVCLQKIYQDFKQEIKDDEIKQEELKRPYKIKIEDYKGDNARLEKRIEKIQTETIPNTKIKIERLKSELSHIRKNPHEITGDDAGKASFYIGGIILLFLTVYLFIFYSSASYSAFFKEFSMNEIGVANSIFDSKALSKAYNDGLTELVLILTIPFVFLGLGYLIHKFQEQKGFVKYIKIALLIVVTFLFDSILAYEITEKIYNIKKDNSFKDIPDYSISSAYQSVNFGLIIFAGFIVYLIWGFVFDFVMDAFGKIDKVKIALEEKAKQINDTEIDLVEFETQIDKITHTVSDNLKEINKLNKILEGSIVPKEFELDIFSFATGWMSWMRQSGKLHEDLEEAEKISHEFVKVTVHSLEPLN